MSKRTAVRPKIPLSLLPRTTRRRLSGFRNSKPERGSTLVEFALIAMLFLTMILAIIDFSRALYTYHFLSHAARQATRWAAVNGALCNDDGSCNGTNGMNSGPASATDIANYVKNLVPDGIDPNKVTTNVTWPDQANSPDQCDPNSGNYVQGYPGCTVKVQVIYEFDFLYPIVRSTSLTLSSSSEMVIAH